MLQIEKFFLLSFDSFGHIVSHRFGWAHLVKVGLWQGVMMEGLLRCDPMSFLWENPNYLQEISWRFNKGIFSWKLVSKFACFAFRWTLLGWWKILLPAEFGQQNMFNSLSKKGPVWIVSTFVHMECHGAKQLVFYIGIFTLLLMLAKHVLVTVVVVAFLAEKISSCLGRMLLANGLPELHSHTLTRCVKNLPAFWPRCTGWRWGGISTFESAMHWWLFSFANPISEDFSAAGASCMQKETACAADDLDRSVLASWFERAL